MKPAIKFCKRSDGVKLAYSVFGIGHPLVVPAPWITNLSSSFEDPFIMKFWMKLSKKFTVILYDKHGCGHSDRNRQEFNLDTEIKDIETIIDNLGLQNIILFGNSMAGPATITYAYRNQENIKKLILYGSFANGKNLAKIEMQSAVIGLIKASWGIGSKTLAEFFIPNATAEEVQSFSKFQKESSSARIAAELLKLTYTMDVTDLLEKITIPTLILHRKNDKAINIENGKQLAYNILDADFKVLNGSIHFPFYGDQNEIIKEIFNFLSIDTDEKIFERESDINEQKEVAEQQTIVFTDIVSSTKILTQFGDIAARDCFLEHDKIITGEVKKYGGRELQNLGDGFMLSFSSASSAIKCACSIQKEISKKIPMIEIRVGINTGEVVIRQGEHPFGQAIVISARIIARCKGCQILVSDLTKQLVAGSQFSFSFHDKFIPKGFEESLIVHEVNF